LICFFLTLVVIQFIYPKQDQDDSESESPQHDVAKKLNFNDADSADEKPESPKKMFGSKRQLNISVTEDMSRPELFKIRIEKLLHYCRGNDLSTSKNSKEVIVDRIWSHFEDLKKNKQEKEEDVEEEESSSVEGKEEKEDSDTNTPRRSSRAKRPSIKLRKDDHDAKSDKVRRTPTSQKKQRQQNNDSDD
jgi:hypothetical protein